MPTTTPTTPITEEKKTDEKKSGFSLDIKALLAKITGKKADADNDKGKNKKPQLSLQQVMTKKNSIIVQVIAGITFLAAVGLGYYTYNEHNEINAQAANLNLLSNFGDISINQAQITAFGDYIQDNISSISHLLAVKDAVEDKLEPYQKLFETQSSYYNLFLRNIYLPSLNIRKDPYTQIVDTSIIGQKYLEKDKFQDLYLIQYRSNFFSNVGENAEYNEISEINLGEMEDTDPEHFIIPVTIKFVSPNKRSFLLLVNKLSITSNITNVSLLNEFFFYLVKNIEELKADEIKIEREKYIAKYFPDKIKDTKITEEEETESGSGEDEDTIPEETIIGYTLRERMEGTGEISLLDAEVINATIIQSTNCETLDALCLFRFREKYRELPYLAYTIGMPMNPGQEENRVTYFKDFISSLAPIIAVKAFNFEKEKSNSILDTNAQTYRGSISFNVYGRSVSDSDRDEIAQILGNECFGREGQAENAPSISTEEAIRRVEENLMKIGDNLQSSDVVNNLEELKKIFETIQRDFGKMNNYHKVIKIFEIHRMLKNANLCYS